MTHFRTEVLGNALAIVALAILVYAGLSIATGTNPFTH